MTDTQLLYGLVAAAACLVFYFMRQNRDRSLLKSDEAPITTSATGPASGASEASETTIEDDPDLTAAIITAIATYLSGEGQRVSSTSQSFVVRPYTSSAPISAWVATARTANITK